MQNENKPNMPQTSTPPNRIHYNAHRLTAVLYDIPMLVISVFIFLYLAPSVEVRKRLIYIAMQFCFAAVCVFSARIIAGVYRQILRYGGSRLYIRLILADVCAGAVYYGIQLLLPEGPMRVTFIRAVCVISFNLLEAVASRLLYQFVFEYGSRSVFTLPGIRSVVHFMTGYYSDEATEQVLEKKKEIIPAAKRKKLAVVGAGRIGAMLVKELLTNQYTAYAPVCFIDNDKRKAEREIYGIPVLPEDDNILSRLKALQVEEIVFALPRMHAEQKNELYERYRKTGCKILIYDYPLSQTSEFGKRTLREFRIEELLFRDAKEFMNDDVRAFYAGKTILVTGGGGSIGSELCRQVAAHEPAELIIFDIYENNAYDIQLELKDKYPDLKLVTLIGSVRDSRRIFQVFDTYRPQVVYHAAAHKHVPLMEDSPCEAVKNNVIGTYKTAYAAMVHGCERFVLISTDKAVNPTNVMGTSKRLCEMIIQCFDAKIKAGKASEIPQLFTHLGEENADKDGTGRVFQNVKTEFVAARFGNVLGSNGSVIGVFKKQIAKGGPVTVTHPDIIRYFMTIPEAVSLVMLAGTYAHGGEIFVLDMGRPVKIDTLARNLIKLAGFKPGVDIEIEYTGLRPGEKLYEEKLMAEEGLRKTDNKLIHIGSPIPFDHDAFLVELVALMSAAYSNKSDIRDRLMAMVPTYHPAVTDPAEPQKAVS